MRLFELDKRSSIISQEHKKIYKSILANSSEAISALDSDIAVWRGMKNLPNSIILTDPNKKQRKSANTKNYYTLLFSNLPSWVNFPRRDHSLICSTSQYKAWGYGQNLFLVLPFNNAVFGICPSQDIWDSKSKYIKGDLGFWASRMNMYGFDDREYHNLIKEIYKIYKESKSELRSIPFSSAFIKNISKSTNANEAEQLISKMLSPKSFGFKTANISNLPRYTNREVWTNSKCYLINIESEFFKKYFKKVNEKGLWG